MPYRIRPPVLPKDFDKLSLNGDFGLKHVLVKSTSPAWTSTTPAQSSLRADINSPRLHA